MPTHNRGQQGSGLDAEGISELHERGKGWLVLCGFDAGNEGRTQTGAVGKFLLGDFEFGTARLEFCRQRLEERGIADTRHPATVLGRPL